VDGDAAAIAAAAYYVNGTAKYVLVPEKLNSQHCCVIVMLTLLLSCSCPSVIFFRNTLSDTLQTHVHLT
jgi:hypothetical protein